MTTAALTVPYLDVPTQEDVMELSTDFDRQHGTDGDTDIDIDLVLDRPQDQDNDYMIEDTRSEVETGGQTFPDETGNDDVMLDEEGSQGDINEANILQDEDLDDAGDYLQDNANQDSLSLHGNTDEYHDDTLQRIHQITSQADRVFSPLPDNSEDKTREDPEIESLDNREEDVLGSLDTEDNAEVLKQNFQGSNVDDSAGSTLEDTRDVLDWSEIPTSTGDTETGYKAANEDLERGLRPEEVTSKPSSPTPSSIEPQHEQVHEATSVHPVVVVYQDIEISLFPPSDQSDSPTFFLHDESLATSSIYDLLLACKGVLADSISEEDELELNIEELGLCISEESKSASHTTLSQILNIYLQLLHQDGTSDVGPLYMNLRIRTSFPKRLRGLIDAAKNGKGISQLPYWEVPSDDDTATAADGDVAYDNAEEQTEDLEASDGVTDKLSSDLVDNTSTQGQLGVSKTDATVSQGGSVVLEPSHDHDSSQVPEIERSAVNLDRLEARTSDGLLETTLSASTGSGANGLDRKFPPEEAENTRRSQVRVTSAHFLQANEEEDGDLIDYEGGEDPPIQESTGSSTLAGDEAAGAANEDEPHREHDHEINSLTTKSISEVSNKAPVESEESNSLTREAVQAPEDIDYHTNQIQEEHEENGDDEDYKLGNDEETFQPGIDDATAKQSEQQSQFPQAQHSEESVALETSAGDSDRGNETTGVSNPYRAQDLRVNGETQQHLPDLTVLIDESKLETDAGGITSEGLEDTIDDYDQTPDTLETNQADFEASRHDLSGKNGVVVGKPEDPNPYAVAPASTDDNDEIDYDEDEIVDLLSQHAQEEPSNLEIPSPSKPASIKRSRSENAEQDAPDDGSQDIKRVRSS